MSKYNGLTQKKKDARESKKRDGVGSLVAGIAGQTQKFINEWTEKHNKMKGLFDAVFKIATTEMGKLWANQQTVSESIDRIDLNVLALAELSKDVYKRLARSEMLFKKLEELAGEKLQDELVASAEIEASGQALYKEAVKQAFEVVQERQRVAEEARKAAAEKAAAEAKAAEEAKKEAELAEKALREAESEKLEDATSGGKGADIPEGAQVFGG